MLARDLFLGGGFEHECLYSSETRQPSMFRKIILTLIIRRATASVVVLLGVMALSSTRDHYQ